MSIVLANISLLSLINARCFIMCQVLGIHLFQIGHHWSFFLFSLLFPFLLSGGFTLGFFWQYIICSLVFPVCPLCPFVECLIFPISNNLHKGSNQLSPRGICHGCSFGLKIIPKIECNNVFLSWIEL